MAITPRYQEMLDEGGLEQIRRRRRRGARSALRKLHGPLRLRSERRARHELPARRQLEEFQIQLRRQTEALLRRPRTCKAFNGVSIGKGHLAEAKAAINSPRAAMNGAQSAFSNAAKNRTNITSKAAGGCCGTGDTSQRDELLAKIAAKQEKLRIEAIHVPVIEYLQ